MAIIDSIALGKARGSLGNVTLRKGLGGTTIASQKVPKKGTPIGSHAQMVLRMQMANLVNLWQAFNDRDKPSFESKGAKQSDFNAFVSKNMKRTPAFLTKTEASRNGSVATPILISEGSLPSISYMEEDGMFITDISLGNLTISATTTVAAFSQAVIEMNDWLPGEQINFFEINQALDPNGQVPYVKIWADRITLDPNDTETHLYDVVSSRGFASVDGKLGSTRDVNGCRAYIRSRNTPSGVAVSSQSVVGENNLLAQYTDEAALKRAIDSYGGELGEQFLQPKIN